MRKNQNGKNVFEIIIILYFGIGTIMTFYFWWEWAQNHGFWSSFLLGAIVGIFKGVFWIFFIW
jgi:hypothetical protein